MLKPIQVINDTNVIDDESIQLVNNAMSHFSDLNYNVLSIIGCQSGGKSTLLNALFNVSFEEMNCLKGRSQTTRGVWFCAIPTNNFVVLDIEGTDSKERGDDRNSIEHRTTLLSLALSDCVLINLWYNDIGRYNASNFGLLRTVIQLHISLFSAYTDETPTKLFFVIRDWHNSLTPADILKQTLIDDLLILWKEIVTEATSKSSSAAGSSDNSPETTLTERDFDKYFSVEVCVLPNAITELAHFTESVTSLRSQISDFLNTPYSRRIPADGFARYFSQIWQNILSCEQLNIPSQRQMVSEFRCGELIEPFYQKWVLTINALNATAQATWPKDKLTQITHDVLTEYKNTTRMYCEDVSNRKKQLLVNQMLMYLNDCYTSWQSSYFDNVLLDYADALKDVCAVNKMPEEVNDVTLNEAIHSLVDLINRWNDTFDKTIHDVDHTLSCSGFEIDSFNYFEPPNTDKKDELEQRLLFLRSRETIYIKAEFDKIQAHEVREMHSASVCFLHKRSLDNFWKELTSSFIQTIMNLFSDKVAIFRDIYYFDCLASKIPLSIQTSHLDNFDKLKSFENYLNHRTFKEKQKQTSDEFIKKCLIESYLTKFNEYTIHRTDILMSAVFEKFKNLFETDSDGSPRNPIEFTRDELISHYNEARNMSIKAFDEIFAFNFDISKIEHSFSLPDGTIKYISRDLSMNEKTILIDSTKNLMKSISRSAQAVNACGTQARSIPPYFYALLFILGWNELLFVLRNPILLMALIGLVTLFGYLYFFSYLGRVSTIFRSVRYFIGSHLVNTSQQRDL